MNQFYGWENGNKAKAMYAGREWTPGRLYQTLKKLWSRETCAPRMREEWSEENPTLGQCSITAFLAQDIFGGKVYGVPLGDGNFHCWSMVDGIAFDLTSEQFGGKALDYSDNPEQFRYVHFSKAEKRQRYEALKTTLLLRIVEEGDKRLALTFDDGPNTEITPQVLDILEENDATASFFLISDSVTEESAKAARRAYDMGCEINNHSKTHSQMGKMTAEEISTEIADCTEKIKAITGEAPRFFRPPYIDLSETLFDTVDLTFICGVGCQDWVPQVSAQERIDCLLNTVQDGDLILLHDMPGNVNTVEALRAVIPEWKKRGFRFVTCGQLFAEAGVKPLRGWSYSSVYQKEQRR